MLALSLMLAACGSSGSQPSVTISAAAPSITTQPANQTVTAGQTATFSVTALGTTPLTYQWQKGTVVIAGATSSTYTTTATTTSDSGSQYSVVVSNAIGNATSNPATLTVNAAAPATTDVLTYHNDVARTGQNLTETTLTTANVNSTTFGKIGFYSVDGLVDAEPLYASNVTVPNSGQHNVLIVATEHGSVYAFDADSGATIWQVTTMKAGETTSDDRGCSQITPEIGVTSTPVIDRASGPDGAVYVAA
ncbi:MAG: immunoglobulin domain-containing protein, partial [Candidatus Sulfotelmatobacter sp.]